MDVGIREDLSDMIYMISPTETPALASFGRGDATQVLTEWQMDALAAAGDNAELEGADATEEAHLPTLRMGNSTQISTKTILISGSLESANKAGRTSELSYQLAKRAKELKRDIEFGIIGQTNATLTGQNKGAVATARRSATVMSMFHDDGYQEGTADGWPIESTAFVDITGTLGGWDNSTSLFDPIVDGTARPLLESMLKGVIRGAWSNGGDPTLIMCGPFNKVVISAFTGNSTRFDRGEDRRLVAAIDVYVSDYGEHRVVPNRFQRDRDVFAFTPELWEVKYFRGFRQHALSKTGDSEKRQVLAEWTLCGKNNTGNGWIGDLTTT
jgi:hypothetical protein